MSLPTEPYSRIERYLAKIAGQDVDIPDKPITRIECYLDYIVNNGGGGYTPASNAGAHNGIFRGQSLGTEFTADQSEAITGGAFDEMFIGDYWTINDTVYRIAGFDIFLHMGDPEFTAHHVVIVPDKNMYNSAINSEDVSSVGYAGSAIKTTGLDAALATIKADFGESHILSRSTLLCTSVSGGAPSTSWIWQATQIDLMNESQVFGRSAWGTQVQNGANVNERYSRFPLFELAPEHVVNRTAYWLQDVRNGGNFSGVDSNGSASPANVTTSRGVRPYFCIA